MRKSFREIVKARIEQLGWTTYRLSEECQAKGLKPDLIYRFVSGKQDTTSDKLQKIFTVLNLRVIVGKRPK